MITRTHDIDKKNKPKFKLKWWYLPITILLLIAPIYIINEMYKINVGYLTLWDASDAVLYYISFLNFLGTVVLGRVALYQNGKLMELEEARLNLDLQPFVTVTNCSIEKIDFNSNTSFNDKAYIDIEGVLNNSKIVAIKLEITNTNNAFTIVNYLNGTVYNSNAEVDKWKSIRYGVNRKLNLNAGETNSLYFCCTEEKLISYNGKKIKLELILENKFNKRYKEIICLIFPSICKDNGGNLALYYSAQEYSITEC